MSKIFYRKANSRDDLWGIANGIYGTDPYIYPAWYGSPAEFADAIAPRMSTKGFVFHYDNLYIAKYSNRHEPVGVLCILTPQTDLNFGYKKLRKQNERVIDEYIKPSIKDALNLPKNIVYGMALCVHSFEREHGVGEQLLRYAFNDLKKKGYSGIQLDCLRDNIPALCLYHKLGLEIISEGFGFKKNISDEEVPIVTLSGAF